MLQRIKAFVRDSKGVAALEYALLIGIIVVGMAVAFNAINDEVVGAIDDAKDKVAAERSAAFPTTP